jgi:hypothetical protein
MGHLLLPGDGFERADQHAAGLPLGLARNVHAGVAAIDDVDVGIAGVTEQDQVAGRGSAMRVGGGVGRVIVGTEIGLGFHDAAGEEAGVGRVDQELAQKAGGHQFRLSLKERSRKARRIVQIPLGDGGRSSSMLAEKRKDGALKIPECRSSTGSLATFSSG